MAKKVVIVESATKARTISRYLGKGYTVKECRGHVRDLPESDFGVDIENSFEPTYEVMPGSRRIVGTLRKLAKGAEEVYLAPDPDREGEAIAWHLKHILDVPDERVMRVTFNEITKAAVRQAFEHPRPIDENLVNAQQARRILDRIVGYELSPLVSSKVVRGLSAGRVQSVALRLIVEREREHLAFVPEEYWEIKAVLHRRGGADPFEAQLRKLDGKAVRIGAGTEAEALVERLRGEAFVVASVEKQSRSAKAPPPFITSTMQRAANTALGYSAAQTMRIAQQLYEGIGIGAESVGLISYMRTDSTRVAGQALGACRDFIGQSFGADYVPARPNTFRSPRGAQAAHEAIRPTDVRRRPDDIRRYLDDRQRKLYDLIWRRFVASQMTPARYEVTSVAIEAGPATFAARGRVTVFDGFTRVARRREEEDQALPPLGQGDALDLEKLEPSQHFTQPPPRYTEASLVRELERQGIGRPSTYAPTIGTLLHRNYVRRERRALRPTDLGMVVTDLLVKHFPRELAVAFTSHMEDEFDEIEAGKRDWRETLAKFYGQFSVDLARAEKEMESVRNREPEEPVACDECGRPMVVKFSRKGDRFLSCSGFPECKGTKSLGDAGDSEAVETEFKCDKCGAPMLRRLGRRGRHYLACSAFPKCSNIMGLDRDGKPVKLKPRVRTGLACPRCGQDMHLEGEGEEQVMVCAQCRNKMPLLSVEEAMAETELDEENDLPPCDECGKPMTVKQSRKGMFLGCTGYPDCKATAPLPKKSLPRPRATFERCEKCGRPLAVRWGQYGRFLSCTGFPACRNLWRITGRRRKCRAEGCGARLMKKIDKEGKTYLGCMRFPHCDYTERPDE